MKQKSGRITRAISVLLTLAMLLTLLPTVVFAADDPAAQYGDIEYATLSDALTAAQEGGGGTVRLLRDYTLEEDVTVPSGVTLLVPCMDNDAGYDASTGYCPDGKNTAGVTGANGTRYCTLTIPQGVTLTVMGTVLVNAVVGRPASGHYDQDVTGGYGEIALDGSIEILSGGIVDCCGYIKGSGQVTVENGGTLRDLYVVIHWRGGSAAYGAKKASVYPMNESKCHNVETTVRINYGGTYSGTVKMYAKSPFTLKDTYQYTRFPQIDNSNGLFRLSAADSYVIKTYDAATDREIYSFYGGATFASSSLNIVGQNLSTSEFIYPIDGDMIFNLNHGSYTFANDYKFMPGAVVNIQNAALTVNSGKTVVFYSTDIYTKDPFTTVTGTSYPVSRGDAVLKLSSDSELDVQGAFGGKVSAQAPDSVIQKGTNANLSVTTNEVAAVSGSFILATATTTAYTFPATFTCEHYTGAWDNDTWKWTGDPCTLTLKYGETTIREPATMEYGTQADPEPYSLVGYDFGGWYTDVALTNPYTPGPITGDMTLYAKMTPCSYTITFDSKSGSTVEPITQDYETVVTAPAAPTRKGYTFAGWYADEELREAYSFGTMPAQDITLYAKWDANTYTVTFDAGEGTVSPENKTVTFDQTYSDLPTPTRAGYDFVGWYLENTLITENSVVTAAENHTLTAAWNARGDTQYTVEYWTEGLDGTYTVERTDNCSGKTDSMVTAAPAQILGFTHNQTDSRNVLSGTVAGDGSLVLKLYYTRNQYTVTYYDGDTQIGKPEAHLYGEKLIAPEYSKDGYDFVGWYTDEELKQPNTFITMPAEHLALYAKLEARPYTVTYMDGETKLDEQTVCCGNSFELQTPTKTGYTFAGWYTDPELTAAYTSAPMPAEDLTLYAQWKINTYTVTFRYVDENENPIQADTTRSVQYQGAADLPSTAIAGYRFSRAEGAMQNITEDTTVTLHYVSYLTLLDNYVSAETFDSADRKCVEQAEGYYQNLTPVQRDQYCEMGSYKIFLPAVQTLAKADLETDIAGKVPPTNALLADPTYVGDGGAVAKLTQPEANVVYVDMLRPDFHANGMLSIPFLSTLFSNEEITGIAINGKPVVNYKIQFDLMYAVAEATIDVPEGYETLEEYLRDNMNTLPIRVLDGKQVTATVTGTTLGDVTYQTTYEIHFFNHEHELRVDYKLPDGTQAADSKTLTLGYGDRYEVESPEVTGYTAEAATGTMGIADTVVTVTYVPNEYTVMLDPDGGTLDGEKTLTVWYGEAYGTLPEPVKAGYQFTGWYDAAGSRVNASTVYVAASDTTLTAHWSVSAYTITYVVDGVTVQTATYDFGATITPYTYTKEGYTISAWSPAVPATMPAENLTVSATSTVNTYTVTYQVNGETVNTVQYAYGAEIEPYTYTLTGYTVGAWNETVPATMPARDLTVTADATVNTYTVTYVVDGKQVHEDSVPYGTAIPAYTYSKTGYTFSGWDAALPETMPAQNLTLNGTTTVNAYTITFDSNGGSAVASVTADYGTALTQPEDPTRTGYTFRGWYTDTALTKAFLFTTMPAEDVTLYAKWEANTYTLHFDSDGGSSVEDRTVTYGQPYGALPTPEKQGYTFTGWQMADGTAVNANLTVTRTEDHTVYAVWTPKGDTPYTVYHYQQGLDGMYTLTETETRTSATGAAVTAVAKSYEGFNYDAELSTATGTVTADGGLMLKLYYTRNQYTVTWVVDGNETSKDYPFGATPEFTGSTDKAGDATHEFRFTGWSPAVATVTGDATYTAQYYEYYEAVIGGQTYLRLTDALAAAQSGDTVVLHEDVTLVESAVVPAGVMLLIPCMDHDVGYDPATGYCPDGTSTAGKTGVGPAAACYRKLTIAEDAALTVDGTVLVNAVTGRPAAGHYDQDITGSYGEITLEGSLVVRSGGTLDVCGYLNGAGSVTAECGGTVYDLYVVRNWRGGSQASVCYDNNVYPMNEYDCHNITAPLTICSGATYSGTVKMYAANAYRYTRFPQVDNENGLIRLTGDDGYAVKTFENGREVYTIYGGADFARSTLEIVGVLLTTGNFVYPIDGDISLRLHDGTYTFVDRYKFLTGAEVTAENANVTIPEGNLVVFYDEFHDVQNTDNTQYPERPAATLTLGSGGSLTVGGTLAGEVHAQEGVGAITKGDHATFLAVTKEANGYTNGARELQFAAEFLREGYTPRWVGNTLVWVSADFTEVDAAMETVPEDLSIYSDESVAKLRAAIDAVDYTQPDQTVVDGYAAAILAAIDGLAYRTYTITWDVDGVQTTMQVPYGTVPSYDGTPVKAGNAQYSYAFRAWEPAPTAAAADATYTAQFTATVNRYTATFVNDGGETVKAQNVEYGDTVTAPSLPARDDMRLEGWASEKTAASAQYAPGSEIPVTGACTFYPVWHVHRYAAVVTEPTVSHGGYTTYTCDCGDSYVADLTDPLPDLSDRFSDVPENWAYPGIVYCVEHGLMDGVGEGRFDPNGATTRAMIVTILWRQAGSPAPENAASFTDLTQDWYRDAVAWAEENGIARGRGASNFDPDTPITREELATFLQRFTESVLGKDVSDAADLTGFPDADTVSDYARPAVAWANAVGLIQGDAENDGVNYLRPAATATRAQAATILMRFCENIAK
ncbi:MAG: InlB B-repeat-containing protein [Clostridiales bacterium]|nr:InlB B-repeat-containing protein [Clostridiales bacterium]MDD6936956.1 InlB B-repeat-containing protein [Clostridiales bacterium]MDY2961372.1 InlB B-repeat-containing protein [Oscillospiraceae bacterium]